MNERDPQQAKQYHKARGNAAEIYELVLGRLRTNLLVEIQRHEGGCGVEHGAHRSHHGRKQGRHDQTDKAGG